MILISFLVYAAGWLTIIFGSSSMIPAIIGRFITGLGTGFISVAAPNYIGEVATPDIRGFLGAAFQMFGKFKNLYDIQGPSWTAISIPFFL